MTGPQRILALFFAVLALIAAAPHAARAAEGIGADDLADVVAVFATPLILVGSALLLTVGRRALSAWADERQLAADHIVRTYLIGILDVMVEAAVGRLRAGAGPLAPVAADAVARGIELDRIARELPAAAPDALARFGLSAEDIRKMAERRLDAWR